jgi:hypothetical protein
VKHSLSQSILHRFLFALSIVVLAAHACLPAEAQNGQKPNAPNKQSNRTAKDFQFEIVSIRPADPQNVRVDTGRGATPDGYRVMMNLSDMIKLAYSPGDIQRGPLSDPTNVINLPGWGFWYVIDARVAENDIHAWQAQGKNQELLRSAMRALLKERFRLVLHEQQTKIPVYNLVVSRKGIRFKPSAPGAVLPVGYKFPDGAYLHFFRGMIQVSQPTSIMQP